MNIIHELLNWVNIAIHTRKLFLLTLIPRSRILIYF